MSADNCNFVQICTESLDEMEKSVRELFGAVPNTDATIDEFNGTPFEPDQLMVCIINYTSIISKMILFTLSFH